MNPDAEYYQLKTETEVLFPVSGPDLTDTVTKRVVIPERVLISLHREFTPEQDGGREWAHVAVYGPRRLKSGDAGHEINSFGWESTTGLGATYVSRPDWLTQELADHLPDGWNPALIGLKAATCDCGKRIPVGRVAYCSDACRLADDDHGPDEVGGDES